VSSTNILSGVRTVRQAKISVRIVALSVATSGLIIIVGTLVNELVRERLRAGDFNIGLSLLIGLTLIYLSRSLSKKKKTAWVVSIALYVFILALNLIELSIHPDRFSAQGWVGMVKNIIIPVIVLIGLVWYRSQYNVRSDLRSFNSSIRFILLILGVAFLYGITGFELLDKRDFHKEISLGEAMHRTIDQFDLTTNAALTPYTHRARLFLDSLSIISFGAVSYGVISLFQPIKTRFVDQSHNRSLMRLLLETYPSNSEDFFKLWPHDKEYFFSSDRRAGLAYHVRKGVALVVGDMAGDSNSFAQLIKEFDELCYVNDWDPTFIHTESKYTDLFNTNHFTAQKIGEEAILDITKYQNTVANNKYFRNIKNKFEKTGFKTKVLYPPHSFQVVNRLDTISKEWLNKPGREERGFMMGYFSTAYIQLCPVMVVVDGNDTIQAFINQIPSYDESEANYDLLRHADLGAGNINDFLLINFIKYLSSHGYKRLNLGLCPLSGLDKKQEDRSIIDNALRFAYANGDRVYSFSGLHRFKSKYEPEWSDRYVVYRGGVTGFIRTINTLNSVWKIRFHI
jgi:phosphatidylglycerol lysyltransferase